MTENEKFDAIDSQAILGEVELFRELEAAEVREMLDACEALSARVGEVLFRQGDPADALYIVESGELQVRAASLDGEDVVLAMLGPGSVVGEMSLIAGGPRSATVEVLSDARILRLSHAAFDGLRRAHSKAAYRVVLHLARILGNRRRVTDARVNEVFADPAQYLDNFESQLHDMLGRLKKA